jgi:hypothetical protein
MAPSRLSLPVLKKVFEGVQTQFIGSEVNPGYTEYGPRGQTGTS